MIKWYINVIFLINPISPLLDYGCHNCNSKSKIHRNELSVSLIEIKSRIVTPLFTPSSVETASHTVFISTGIARECNTYISRCISLLYIRLNAADCHAENSLRAINRDWVFQKRSKVWFLPENVTQQPQNGKYISRLQHSGFLLLSFAFSRL